MNLFYAQTHTHRDSDKYSIVAFCKNATIIRFHPPPGFILVHWCFGKRLTIDNCHRSWPDDDVHKACEFGGQSYVFVTYDTGSQTYTDMYKTVSVQFVTMRMCLVYSVYLDQLTLNVVTKSFTRCRNCFQLILNQDFLLMCPKGELYIETE